MSLSELLNLPEIDRNVDIVFVIDAAKTMQPIIDKLQQVDLLYDKLLEVCSMQGKSLNFRCSYYYQRGECKKYELK